MTKQTIGFDRELQLAWLDLTAGLVQEELDLDQIRRELLSRLKNEIPGEKACKNTITVLTRIWVRVSPENHALHREALTLISTVLPEERLWLHWGMSLLAYPFFYGVATTVGRFIQLQQQLESVQVQRRMRESWGQRTTVERAVSRVLKTFANWNTIQTTTSDPYLYHLSCVRQTTNANLALWLIECLIQSVRQAAGQNDRQIPLIDLIQSPAAFPFDLTAHAVTLRRSDRFQVSHQGLDLEMVTPS